ncbi:MAG: transposase [Verrucomicrobiaceae bacterium]|nr:transposase [Verrucomicrobiaceae bacterium]
MNTTGTKKRAHDEQFKRDAVALLDSGRKAAQLARELGISPWNLRALEGTLRHWRSQPCAANSNPSALRITF